MSPSISGNDGGNTNNGVGFRRHVSGSAYKIVNNRAYHHGTMLISSELGTLGRLLHSNKVLPNPPLQFVALTSRNKFQDTMQTKGVASVRSPVCNLKQHNPNISHEDFVHAIVHEFQDHYNIQEPVGWWEVVHPRTSLTRSTLDQLGG